MYLFWSSCFWIKYAYSQFRASHMMLVVKNPPADAGDIRDVGLILGSGRSPGGGHGNQLQYSCLENPMDRGAWLQFIGLQKGWTGLKWLSMHTCSQCSHNIRGLKLRKVRWHAEIANGKAGNLDKVSQIPNPVLLAELKLFQKRGS